MIEITSNDYLLCNYVIFLIDICVVLEGHIRALIQGEGGIWGMKTLLSLIYGN